MATILDLFYVYSGSKLDFEKQEESEDGILFISRNSNNNGVVGRVLVDENTTIFKKGDITVPLGGEYLLSAFVQDEDFVTAQNVAVLRPRKAMTQIEKWFYCYVLRKNAFKFCAFGREVNKYLEDIEVPDTIPDWAYKVYIEDISTSISLSTDLFLDTSNWLPFEYNKIFTIKKGFYNKKPEHNIDGKIPFLGATDNNNGVTEYYSLQDIAMASKTGDDTNAPLEEKIFAPHAVCVTNNGSVGYAYYQPEKFTCSHDVTPLYRIDGDFNKYTAMFIICVIEHDRYRWTYGRKWRPIRMKNSVIKLPADINQKPDWDYMEKFIKSLPYSDRI